MTPKNWRTVCIPPEASIRDALEAVNNGSMSLALVVDSEDRLLGLVTDGDLRRGLLQSSDFGAKVSAFMKRDFISVPVGQDDRNAVLTLMRRNGISHVPVLDSEGRIVDLKVQTQIVYSPTNEHEVVLMAGGLGSRLAPLTENCPKPLLDVGGRPILETILMGFVECGFRRFHISVNYKAQMIEDYFGDGSKFGVHIDYLRETERLGTAGCLDLLPQRPRRAFMVMNADLLTRISFDQFLHFHLESGAMGTMAVRSQEFRVPFGVVRVDQNRLVDIEEKPAYKLFVNAGIYILDPLALDFVEPGQALDMPDLFRRLLNAGHPTNVFPVHEYWLDIGQPDDYGRAREEFCKHFEE